MPWTKQLQFHGKEEHMDPPNTASSGEQAVAQTYCHMSPAGVPTL